MGEAATLVPGISEKPTGVGTNTILTDRLGSMKGMANAGNVTETAEFDAFGKVVAHNLPSATQKGFASGYGYQEDGESGYKLLGHRYYDPESGRFLSRDPAQKGRNWYAYCDNNPLKRVDPNGLDYYVFDGYWLIMYDDYGRELDRTMAASGQPGTTPLDTGLSNKGPLPEGEYEIDPGEIGHYTTSTLDDWFNGGYTGSIDGWGNRRASLREDRPLTGAPCHPEAAAAVRDIVIEQRAQRFLVDPPILGDGRGGRGKYTSEFKFHAEPRGYRKNRGEV